MSAPRTVVIDVRFRGPPDSGNGGYVCGLVGTAAGEPVVVRLMRPPPLGVPLELSEAADGIELRRGEELVATATPDPVALEVPAAPDHAAAIAASLSYSGFTEHAFPCCFVCGPRRLAGDGLRIFAGPLRDGAMVAAPWLPDGSLADECGHVRPEFLWAALDCPGYFATPLAGRVGLLGEMAVRISGKLVPGEPCVVIGWLRHSEGRKHHVGTALFGRGGERVAWSRGLWIEPRS